MSTHQIEVAQGRRFEFGRNWQRFLDVVDERRIELAQTALAGMLGRASLQGLCFLDIGSGSGLSSLAAWRLGARVHSFDYDPASVACTRELRQRHAPGAAGWQVEEGSVLDAGYLASLGQFDVVYSWGVLHHTGAMWRALENVIASVRPGGLLFVALYNDQGAQSRRWRRIKQTYNRLPAPLAAAFALGVMGARELRFVAGDLLRLRPLAYLRRWTGYARNSQRGMSLWRDLVDWIGGLPFEVAKPEQVILFYQARGCRLVNLRTCGGGLGCNEFVFERER